MAAALALELGEASAPALGAPSPSADATTYSAGIVYEEVRRLVPGDAPSVNDTFDADESAALRAARNHPSGTETGSKRPGAAMAAPMMLVHGLGALGGPFGMMASQLAGAAASQAMKSMVTSEVTNHASVHRKIVLANGWSRDDDLAAQTAVIVKEGHAYKLDVRAKTYEDVADVPQTDEDAEVPAAPALGTMQLSGFATEKHQTTVSNVALETVYVAQIASPVSVTGSFIVYRTVSSSLKGQKLTSIVERGKIAAPRDEDRALFDIPSDFVKKTA